MRFMSAAVVIALSLACVAPASAASLGGMGKAIFGNAFNFSKANLEKTPIGAITVGKLKMSLQTTRLKDIQKAFGGTLQQEGDGPERADWLCYNSEGATVWFVSNALGGYEFVMMVAAEATTRPAAGCDTAPAEFTVPDLGIPGLGATAAELKTAFGAASGSKIGYRADRPGGYANIAQYIGYTLKSGKVSGIGVGETSVPTEH